MDIRDDEKIVTAWAENASGPGWANQPVWVLLRTNSGELRIECLQPEEQSRDIQVLYATASSLTRSLVSAVKQSL